jgi:hypothetical protein
MKGGTQAALVLGVGYLLGRRRKLRTATVVAAAAATGGVGSLGGAAVKRGLKTLGASKALGDLGPQVSELAEIVRGDLVEAGKAAALASVNKRIGSLSDTLRDRADIVRNPAAGAADAAGAAGAGAAGAADEASDAVQGAGRRARRATGGRGRGAEPEQAEPEDEYGDEPEDDYDDEPEEDDYDDEPEQDSGPAPVRRRRASQKSPVSRARR